MTAFKRFDPYAFLAGAENGGGGAAKVAKPAKVPDPATARPQTLETLATLAGGRPPVSGAGEALPSNVWTPDHEERAAIIAEGAGAPREWAEAFARLDLSRPPHGVPSDRWTRFLDDGGRFLDRWAGRAVALGWTAADLFGCDRARPLARIDCAGLLWLLNGDRLIALTRDEAVIETSTGARQRYRRAPECRGDVLAWELAPYNRQRS